MHKDSSPLRIDTSKSASSMEEKNDISKMNRPPLLEVIAEIRWKLEPSEPEGILRDPHYKLLPGKMANLLQGEYPFLEQLPAADMPEEITSNIVQYRFRKGENEWPLIQLGPGIITINQTGPEYHWVDFEHRINHAINALYQAHQKGKDLKLDRILLRYLDSFPFKFEQENALDNLKKGFKTSIILEDSLLSSIDVSHAPSGLDLKLVYPLIGKKAALSVRFARGEIEGKDVLISETGVQEGDEEAPCDEESIMQWFREAHGVTHNWFFAMIRGPILDGLR